MFFFFHLLIGLVLGILIGDLLHDRRWVIPCAIGAVLPDLIDKPLGYLVFSATINYGRIWFHSLLAVGIVLVAGIVLWMFRKNPLGVAAAVGMFSHQLLDFMWLNPVTWYYPFLGPFVKRTATGRIWTLLLRELSNPWEWAMFGAVVLGIYLFLRIDTVKESSRNHTALRVFLLMALVGLVVVSMILPDMSY